MLRRAFLMGLVLAPVLALPAMARERLRLPHLALELSVPQDEYAPYQEQDLPEYDVALDRSEVSVAPSEAASIAQDVVPGARVVGVKLLPNGYYAVTLRGKGRVTRVFVSAIDGSVR